MRDFIPEEAARGKGSTRMEAAPPVAGPCAGASLMDISD